MAPLTYYDLFCLTRTATGVIRKGRAVTIAGGEVGTAGAKCLGIAKHAATAGQELAVTVLGTAIAVAGGAVTVGAALVSDNQGRLVAATPAAVTVSVAAGATPVTSTAANGEIATATVAGAELPHYIVGYAMTAATEAGDEIEVLLK